MMTYDDNTSAKEMFMVEFWEILKKREANGKYYDCH